EEYDQARGYYGHALEGTILKGDNAQAAALARTLSVLALERGDEEAAACNSEIAFIDKADVPEAVRHGRLMVGLQRYTRARDDLTKFIETQTTPTPDPNVLHVLALAYYGLGDSAQALDLETKALSLNGVDPGTKFEFQMVYTLAFHELHGRMPVPAGSEDADP